MPVERDGIIVVHGIGDQTQRGTLEAFLLPFTSETNSFASRSQVLRIPSGEPPAKPFTYFAQETNIGGRPTAVAEMFWSDLSALAAGFLAPLQNFFKLVAGAPDIVYASLGPSVSNDGERDYTSLRIVRALVALTFWIIYYPIVAYNIAYAVLFLGFLADTLWRGRSPTIASALSAAPEYGLLAAGIGIVVGLVLAFRIKNTYLRAIAAWVVAIFFIGAGLFLVHWLNVGTPIGYREYLRIMNYGLEYLWATAAFLGLAHMIAVLFLVLRFRERWRGILVGQTASYFAGRLWAVLITTCWLVLFTNFLSSGQLRDPELQKAIIGAFFFLGLFWFDVVTIALIFAGSYVLHVFWSRRELETKAVDVKYPRLIVPPVLLYVPFIAAAYWLSAWIFCSSCLRNGQCDSGGCAAIQIATVLILVYASVLLFVGGIAVQFFTVGFKVANDIVNYFRGELFHRAPNPFRAVISVIKLRTDTPGTTRYELRKRLARLSEDFSDSWGPFGRVDLVAHSLGTMIAIDLLRSAPLQFGSSHVHLVTMGSPYNFIFNYYFPHMFPELRREDFPAVLGITNIYRTNDFVGTNLTHSAGFIKECPQLPRGHADYFSDPDVAEQLARINTSAQPV